jgi:hypothetical protein
VPDEFLDGDTVPPNATPPTDSAYGLRYCADERE